MRKLCGGQGFAEEVALSLRTALGAEECELSLRFDALSNHQVLEALSHVNQGAHDRRILWTRSGLVNKGLVNF